MSCQSWWCGADSTSELGQVPLGTRVLLACGCAVERLDGVSERVPVAFQAVLCAGHESSRPHELPASTPVQIDLLASLLAAER